MPATKARSIFWGFKILNFTIFWGFGYLQGFFFVCGGRGGGGGEGGGGVTFKTDY